MFNMAVATVRRTPPVLRRRSARSVLVASFIGEENLVLYLANAGVPRVCLIARLR